MADKVSFLLEFLVPLMVSLYNKKSIRFGDKASSLSFVKYKQCDLGQGS